MALEQSLFCQQSTTAVDIDTRKIPSKLDHWFKSYGRKFALCLPFTIVFNKKYK